jgi:protein involved in polysaccharide export with SLBB domain
MSADCRTSQGRALAVVLAALLCGLWLALQPGLAQAQSADAEYLLGPGDQLRVTVFGQPDLSGEFEIDGSGRLAFPLVGAVQVGGLSVNQAEQAIVSRLKPDYLRDPQVGIEVLNYRPFYIIGEVRSPGSYPYRSGITILNAVAIAGGFTYRADEDSAYLTRGNDPNAKQVEVRMDTVLLPGDIVEIGERYF